MSFLMTAAEQAVSVLVVPTDPDVVSPSEIGVLHAVLEGGCALSLKVHLLTYLLTYFV